ncbi:DSD1 family PLP-dependent enzyme [Lentzea sp. NPDC102401]|uniref:DSD1 family PLP-dependent enzyme n=1 Tax=Lentzea sp. NPDC102401 TaxID=3364128 RepID=UPI0038066E18
MTTVDTPYALIDTDRLDRNAARLRDHLSELGVPLRLHVKTSKSVEVAQRVHADGPITVSTLAEAEHFADAGYRDVLYAVGLDPHRLPRVAALLRRGVTLTVLLDTVEQAEALTRFAAGENLRMPVLIEIDCDGHRGGIAPADPALVHIGRSLGPHLAGVLTHAGESYFARTPESLRQAAQNERDVAVAAAETLRAAGLRCPIVSVGSTPTAHAATDLTGVTEVRAGNYVFFDLVMAGIGVCGLDDLALSVVVTVIGHRHDKNWVLTDGGWMAMSRDRGTQAQAVDQGYGLVADEHGDLIPDLLMTGASQEHGVLSTRDGKPVPDLSIGTRLRILPNHACATAAQHDRYHLASGATWSRLRGW